MVQNCPKLLGRGIVFLCISEIDLERIWGIVNTIAPNLDICLRGTFST